MRLVHLNVTAVIQAGCGVLSLLILCCLSLLCYGRVPGPVILCTFARQQLQQLQQAASGQEQQPGSVSSLYAAPDNDPHMQDCAACQQHLQQRRQRWQQQQLQPQQHQPQPQQQVAAAPQAAADDYRAAGEESDSMS